METTVAVKDEREAYLIQTGLQDPTMRVFLEICALLKTLDDNSTNDTRKSLLHAVCCLYGCDE